MKQKFSVHFFPMDSSDELHKTFGCEKACDEWILKNRHHYHGSLFKVVEFYEEAF